MPGTGIQDAAIVVGRTDLGESDRIVRMVTASHGRVDAVARGARRSRQRFGGALDPGTRGVARWQLGRGSMPTLVELNDIRAPKRAREDWARLILLAWGCEVVTVLTGPSPEPRLHRLLDTWLDLLEGEVAPTDASRVALEAKALTFAGLAPALRLCPRCGRALHGTVRWSEGAGGGVHAGCGTGSPVPAEGLATLDVLRHTPLADTPGREVPAAVRWVLADFIAWHAGAPLRARPSLASWEESL